MDRFAKLAFEGANTLKEELKEITPRELGNQKFMPSSKMAPAEIGRASWRDRVLVKV